MATPSEKEQFIQAWEREFQTTVKLLKEYPANKLELKPSDKSRSAKELAWTFVIEENTLVGGVLKGQIDFQNMPKPPGTLQEIISRYEQVHREMVDKVRKMSDDDYNKTMQFITGPKQMGSVRKADIFWTGLMDTVHHRGQFSVYLRMAGARVPSIYGPSGDEPWM